MNLSDIKKIADILAAAGVLISLLYLGIKYRITINSYVAKHTTTHLN